jgi:hypothetical protein
MATHTSAVAVVVAVGPIAERRHALRRESLRDFVGVGVGVAVGALLWAALLSVARIPV